MTARISVAASLITAALLFSWSAVAQQGREQLPVPDAAFKGVADHTLAGSKPDPMPVPVSAPEGAPNILLILVDDAGFGNPSTFGGPAQTPTLDRVANAGLRFNRFHVVALCSPTRAALLSGRNHHAVGFGSIAELASGWPGYNSVWPKSAASIAQILQGNGYSTAAFGKWHLTPGNVQGAAGPFDRWPSGLGFDYFYGFLPGESNQYEPMVVENNTIIGTPPGKDYYFPTDMADHTIAWIRDQKAQSPDKPFFVYFSTGASHAPHHVPKEWADKYKGKFDQGWDKLREETFARQKALGVVPANAKLTERDPAFPAWDSLSGDEKQLYARQMEVYAGFQEVTDHEIGRVVDTVDGMGLADNTIVIYIWGDNGASMEGTETGSFNELTMQNGINLSAEQQLALVHHFGGLEAWGGPEMEPHYAAAWAWAGNAPFKWGKQVASHFGGTRNPMVIRWPAHIKDKGAIRSQFTHVIDVAPTLLEVAGIAAPKTLDGIEQMPMHGVSFAYAFDDPNAKERHTQQYFEIFGNRAMYKDGWIASARMPRIPWKADPATMAQFAPGKWDPDKDKWELYNLAEDFTQAEDLAEKNPEKLNELKALFWTEAEKYQVLPLLGSMAFYYGFPGPSSGVTKFAFYPGTQNILPGAMPHIYNRSFIIRADLDIPESGAEGVIVAENSFLGGFALYVQDGKLQYTYSLIGVKIDTVASEESLPPGKTNVRYEFVADKPGELGTGGKSLLFVNGQQVAEGRLEHTAALIFTANGGMDIGRDNGSPVSLSYKDKSPFAFTGTIEKVEFDLDPK
jgi:arylsulfatase